MESMMKSPKKNNRDMNKHQQMFNMSHFSLSENCCGTAEFPTTSKVNSSICQSDNFFDDDHISEYLSSNRLNKSDIMSIYKSESSMPPVSSDVSHIISSQSPITVGIPSISG